MTGRGSEQLALNIPQLLERVDNDRELLRELLGLFKSEYPSLLTSLQDAVSQENMMRVEFTAHTLKGMLGSLGAVRAAAAAGHLEQIGNSGNKSKLQAGLEVLEPEIAGLLLEVNSVLEDSAQ